MKKRTEGIIIIALAVAGFLLAIMFLGLDTPLLLVLVFLAVLGVGISVLVDGNKAVRSEGHFRAEDEIVDSRKLHEEMNQELEKSGKSSLEAINTIGGISTNNLARKDKSWSSVPDFFWKLIRKNNKK